MLVCVPFFILCVGVDEIDVFNKLYRVHGCRYVEFVRSGCGGMMQGVMAYGVRGRGRR